MVAPGLAGQVVELPLGAVGAGGEDEPPVGGEHAGAAGEDLAQRLREGGPAAAAAPGRQVGEVSRVAGVAVVPLLNRPAAPRLHLPVQ